MKRALMMTMTACLLASTAASANNELAVRVSNQFVDDKALSAFGGARDLVQAEVDYSRALRYLGRAAIWADVSWTIGQRSGTLLGAFDTSLLVQQITAGMRLTLPLWARVPWLVPELRVEVGALIGEMTLTAPEGGAASDWRAGFTGLALAGVEILLPRAWMRRGARSGVTAGVVIEGGYTYATRLAFTLKPDAGGDTLRMPVSGVDAGTVSLSGGLLRIGALIRF